MGGCLAFCMMNLVALLVEYLVGLEVRMVGMREGPSTRVNSKCVVGTGLAV
jgi:hypothetical protein